MARPRTSSGDIAGVVFALAFFSLFLVTPQETVEATPATPVISFMMASRSTVFETQSSEVFCVAHHDDGSPLTYCWSCDGGTLMPSRDSTIWFAPEESGSYAVSVDVYDDAGAATRDSVTITVERNEPPVVAAVTAEPALLLPGQTTVLSCDALDPEGHSIAYEWITLSGTLSGSGASATWTAPDYAGRYNIIVRVTDELGAAHTRNVMVDVHCPEPPVVDELIVWPSLPDYTKVDINGGYRLLRGSLTQCELECVALAPYGELSYEWTCTEGTIEGRGPIVLFTPPNAITEVHVTVRVSDVCGQSVETEELFKIFQREPYSTEIVTNEVGCLRCLRGY